MKLWLFACLIACFVGAWVPTIQTQGAFEDCCLGYQPKVKWQILQRARFYRQQEVSVSCNIRAVKFYFPRKGLIMCSDPRNQDVHRAMRILDSRRKASHVQTPSPGSQAEKKQPNHGKPKFKNPSGNGKHTSLNHSRVSAHKDQKHQPLSH